MTPERRELAVAETEILAHHHRRRTVRVGPKYGAQGTSERVRDSNAVLFERAERYFPPTHPMSRGLRVSLRVADLLLSGDVI